MDAKNSFWKAIATIVIWVMATGSVALSGVFLADILGEDILGAIFMIMVAAALSSGFIWNWGRGDGTRIKIGRRRRWEGLLMDELQGRHYEKPKRDDQLADALRQLSDRQLENLRDAIRSGDISEDELETMLGDKLNY